MPTFPREVIEEVRSRTDIVDLVAAYVPLRKSGQNLKALCPFHDEKTPSFSVSPARQMFHCFGCGQKGGVFDFVMHLERVDFCDALSLLADRAGVRLEVSNEPEKGPSRRDLYRVHEWAQKAFRTFYAGSRGGACREYVESRRLRPEIVEEFGLGFSLDEWRVLVGRAEDGGISPEALERAGLALRGATRPGLYDRFRGRLMFPIRDSMGRVIAFGARSLDGSEPKYLNSPETQLFQKGRHLFGLERLRNHPREDPVLVMEGYTDVIMSAQVGVRGTVATLGTSLTPDHARLLARYSDRTLLVYDGDSAGLVAAERGARLLLEGGLLHLQVAVLPHGQDPCDFFTERGEGGLSDLLDVTQDLVDFLLERSQSRHNIEGVAGKRQAAEDLVRAAAAIDDPVGREVVLARVASALRLSQVSLIERAAELRHGVARLQKRPRDVEALPISGEKRAQLEFVQALINDPSLADLARPHVKLLPSEKVRRLVSTILETVTDPPPPPGLLLDLLPDSDLREIAQKALLDENHGHDLRRQLEGAVSCLDNRRLENEVRRLGEQVAAQDGATLLQEIQRRYVKLKGGRLGNDDDRDASDRTESQAREE